MNKVNRFDIENFTKKGYRMYVTNFQSDRDKEKFSKMLYYRHFLDNFYIGDVIVIKNRKNEGISILPPSQSN